MSNNRSHHLKINKGHSEVTSYSLVLSPPPAPPIPGRAPTVGMAPIPGRLLGMVGMAPIREPIPSEIGSWAAPREPPPGQSANVYMSRKEKFALQSSINVIILKILQKKKLGWLKALF